MGNGYNKKALSDIHIVGNQGNQLETSLMETISSPINAPSLTMKLQGTRPAILRVVKRTPRLDWILMLLKNLKLRCQLLVNHE